MSPERPFAVPRIARSSDMRSSARSHVSTHSGLAFCATVAILFPAHPSLQSAFLAYGIPAPFVSAIFVAPLLLAGTVNRHWPLCNVGIVLSFLAYICWLLARAVSSPAAGQANYFESLRGIVVLVPLALFCAAYAAGNRKTAVRTIYVFGILALVHYIALMFSGAFDSTAGFRSLTSDSDRANYQSTSFYFGLTAVAVAVFVVRSQGLRFVLGVALLFLILALMGTIGARAPIIAVVVSIVAIATLSGLGSTIRLVSLVGISVVLLVTLAMVSATIELQALQDEFVAIDRFLVLSDGGDSSQRVRLFSSAINMWLASPKNFLIGGGVGAFPAVIGETGVGWYPHNFVLESLAEGGVVAGIFLVPIALLFVIRLRALASHSATMEQSILGALAIYAVITYQFIGGLQTLWIPTFFLVLFLLKKSSQTT